jgi:hypothetical protein
MNYKVQTAWIFSALIVGLAFVGLYPKDWIIWIGILIIPPLIMYQTWVILRAGEESKHTFTDDKWYEDR